MMDGMKDFEKLRRYIKIKKKFIKKPKKTKKYKKNSKSIDLTLLLDWIKYIVKRYGPPNIDTDNIDEFILKKIDTEIKLMLESKRKKCQDWEREIEDKNEIKVRKRGLGLIKEAKEIEKKIENLINQMGKEGREAYKIFMKAFKNID